MPRHDADLLEWNLVVEGDEFSDSVVCGVAFGGFFDGYDKNVTRGDALFFSCIRSNSNADQHSL